MTLMSLLAAYGLCFGLMNDKAKWITDRLIALPLRKDGEGATLFGRMFACPYCTGFHAGWVVWVGVSPEVVGSLVWAIGILTFAFASAAFCYALDTALRWIEER